MWSNVNQNRDNKKQQLTGSSTLKKRLTITLAVTTIQLSEKELHQCHSNYNSFSSLM